MPLQSAPAKDMAYDAMDDAISQSRYRNSQSQCDKASYCKGYDKWFKDYLAGRDAEADKDWAEVLQAARGASDLTPLMSKTNARLMFMDDANASKFNGRDNLVTADKAILASTEKAIGANNLVFASVVMFVGDMEKDVCRYESGLVYFRRGMAILEKIVGKDTPPTAHALHEIAVIALKAGKFDEASGYADRLIALGTKYKMSKMVMDGKLIKDFAARKKK